MVMANDYINNFSNIISSALFYSFIGTIIFLASILIVSLIVLIIGCLLKSQVIRIKFIKSSIGILITLIFVILIPVIYRAFI